MKLHKLNLENNYRNLVDSAIAVKAGLTPAVFAARPTYNDVLLGFNDGETPTLLLPKWAQFTIDLSKNKPSWAPASLTGTLTVTITPSVVGVTAEEDEVTLGNVDVYGVSVASTGKQYKVNEGFYSIGLNVMVVNEDNVPVIAYSDGRPMKVVMQKVADTGPDTNVDVAASGGSFTQEQADWNQSDDTAVDFIKNKPTIPAAQVNADWNAASGVAQILNKPTIPTVNDATLTFTQDGETLATFSANASTNVEVEIPAGGGGGGASIIETTWADLKALRDGGTLTPGQQYRITDYVATTVQRDTSSANHPFDIIVTADSTGKLNEVARAALHAGDSYFANCKMEAWRLWYCLDNDTNRFAWADSTNGKGVIYRMIDEWDNDAPYDFKGIQVKTGANPTLFVFTFGSTSDYSLTNSTYLHRQNTIKPYFNSARKHEINRIALFGNSCSENIFEVGCNDFTSGSSFIGNVLGAECSGQMGTNCQYNTFGARCYGLVIGHNFKHNTVGEECDRLRCLDYAENCTIGNNCRFITFGSSDNDKKSYYRNIIIGDGCSSINLNCTGTTSSSAYYQNVEIACGVKGTSMSTKLTIEDSNTNQAYKTTFFMETDGTLKKQEGSTITTVA